MTFAVWIRADSASAEALANARLIEATTPSRVAVLTDSVHQQLHGFLGIHTTSKSGNGIWHWVPQADVVHMVQAEDEIPEPEARQAFGFGPR